MPKKGYSSVTLPANLVREARRALKSQVGQKYRSLTELASAALKEKLNEFKGTPLVSVRNVSRKEATRLILAFLRKNPGSHYPSDIAYAVGLDPEVAFEVTQSLLHDRVIEIASERKLEAR